MPTAFSGSILPAEGITATVDLEASWSHRDGLNIKGGAGLSTVIDVHKKAGPLRVDTLALALKGGPQGLTGTVGVSGGASIGPVTASVADVGADVALKFARGNLGPVDLGARFKPPTGIGLSVDARGHRDRRRLPLPRRGAEPVRGRRCSSRSATTSRSRRSA